MQCDLSFQAPCATAHLLLSAAKWMLLGLRGVNFFSGWGGVLDREL